MRILQVTIYGELKFGGPPQKIFALSEELVQAGHQVTIATFHSQKPRGSSEIRNGVRVLFLPWRGRLLWQLPLGLRALRREVRRCDVVHLYGLYNLLCPLTALLARQVGKPYLLEPLGMFVPRAGSHKIKALFNRAFTWPMARGAARIVATSPAEQEELQVLAPSNHGSQKLVLRRNGLDLEAFRDLPDPRDLRRRWNIGPDERLVLYIGRISPIKNLEMLVTAFQMAALENARLVLVGPSLEPDYALRLQVLVARLGLEHQVLVAGPLYGVEKLAALSSADLFVLPSQYESFGNAAGEAVAAGVPVLLTEGCGIAPLIHERAGLAVPATQEALADGLRIMGGDSKKRAALVGRRAEVLEELSWEEPLRLSEQMYQAVVQERRPQPVERVGSVEAPSHSIMDFKTIFYPESRFGGFSDLDGTIRFYSRVDALLSPEAVVLDVGCGRGAYDEDPVALRRRLRIFQGRCARVVGIDVDPEAAHNPHLDEFHLIDARSKPMRWPLEDESVDVCVSDFVLEHVEDPGAFFSECRRVLRSGGCLALRTPNARSYVALASRLLPNRMHADVVARVQENRKSQDVFPTLYKCNTKQKIERALGRCGFEHVVYGYEAEPSYLSFSRVAYALGVLHQKLAPGAIKPTLFAFARKRPPKKS